MLDCWRPSRPTARRKEGRAKAKDKNRTPAQGSDTRLSQLHPRAKIIKTAAARSSTRRASRPCRHRCSSKGALHDYFKSEALPDVDFSRVSSTAHRLPPNSSHVLRSSLPAGSHTEECRGAEPRSGPRQIYTGQSRPTTPRSKSAELARAPPAFGSQGAQNHTVSCASPHKCEEPNISTRAERALRS